MNKDDNKNNGKFHYTIKVPSWVGPVVLTGSAILIGLSAFVLWEKSK